MSKMISSVLALACAAVLTAGSAMAQTTSAPTPTAVFRAGDITVDGPWTRATPDGAKVAGGFMKIVNPGKTADRLTAVSSEVSASVEIHEMSMDNGIMKMRPLTAGLEIPAGATVELKPGSYHIMFMDLKKPIKTGDLVKAVLTFEKAGKVEIILPAAAPGAPGQHEHQGHQH